MAEPSVEPTPRWDRMPSDRELLAARRTLKRLTYSLYPVSTGTESEMDVWGGLVEGCRLLTVAVSWLRDWDEARFGPLWEKMLAQDRA